MAERGNGDQLPRDDAPARAGALPSAPGGGQDRADPTPDTRSNEKAELAPAKAGSDDNASASDARLAEARRRWAAGDFRGATPVSLNAVAAQSPPMMPPVMPMSEPELSADWSEAFVDAIERRIVPRLLALGDGGSAAPTEAVDETLARAVAEAALAGETHVVESHVHAYVLGGRDLGAGLINVIGAAARLLGRDWENDTRDFLDVTIGLGTLQNAVMSLSGEPMENALASRRILLGPTPGEHHILGLAIVDHLFRHARWSVTFMPTADRAELMEAVGRTSYAVVGLSLSGDTLVEEARRTVATLRDASANPQVRILMGGPLFAAREAVAEIIGADAVAADGRDAVTLANAWLTERRPPERLP